MIPQMEVTNKFSPEKVTKMETLSRTHDLKNLDNLPRLDEAGYQTTFMSETG